MRTFALRMRCSSAVVHYGLVRSLRRVPEGSFANVMEVLQRHASLLVDDESAAVRMFLAQGLIYGQQQANASEPVLARLRTDPHQKSETLPARVAANDVADGS